uniref:Uncharacterized protein LOC113791365 n=1 Tax=Dermatophagoides pteronyssinus TaxID=6956 RepID=A0A6P6XYA5_DERPT|nr:uncharacterized protein LOC113791365 [Dermatophagoides pteronyssinus]
MKSIQILSTIFMMAIILIDSIQSTQNDWEPILRPNLRLTELARLYGMHTKVVNGCIHNNEESESYYVDFCHELEYYLNSGNKYSDFMNYCMEECLQLHSSQRPN